MLKLDDKEISKKSRFSLVKPDKEIVQANRSPAENDRRPERQTNRSSETSHSHA